MKRVSLLIILLAALLSACGEAAQSTGTPPAPDITLPNAFGGDVSLSDYEGKNVLLFFHMAVG
jgi:hypothetical protein